MLMYVCLFRSKSNAGGKIRSSLADTICLQCFQSGFITTTLIISDFLRGQNRPHIRLSMLSTDIPCGYFMFLYPYI